MALPIPSEDPVTRAQLPPPYRRFKFLPGRIAVLYKATTKLANRLSTKSNPMILSTFVVLGQMAESKLRVVFILCSFSMQILYRVDIQQLMKRESSPLKVKDYFTNPIHRIRQQSFVNVGFTQAHLNTFVKAFTNRYHSRFISFPAIRQFIASFTNHNPKLTKLYQQFFLTHFPISEEGDILLEHFVQFFTKDEGTTLNNLTEKEFKRVFRELGQLNGDNLMAQCQELGVAMSQAEAEKIVKMINFDGGERQNRHISFESFMQAMVSQTPSLS